MSGKPKCKDRDPKRSHEEHRAVDRDVQGEALAECYRVLMEAGAIKPKDGGAA